MFRRILSLIWTIVLITQVCSLASAQTTTNPLQDEVDEAEARAKIAKAKKDEIDARFPKPDRGSLVGGTTINGDIIEAKMLGYCAMKTAAITIKDKIVASTSPITNGSRFIVYNEADVKSLSRYQLMRQRLFYLKSGYDNLCQPPAGGGANPCAMAGGFKIQGLGVGLVANKALEFLSLLKTDIDITGTEIDIGEKEIVAEVFSNLPTYELYYPQRVPLNITTLATFNAMGDITSFNSPLFAQIIKLGEAYDFARNTPAANIPTRNRLDKLYNATMEELGLGDEPQTAGGGGGGGGGACPGGCSQTTNVNVNVGDKEKEESGGGGGSDKTFFSYLKAEKLYDIMTKTPGKSYWLDLQVVKAGGNIRVKSNFITNFMIGSRVSFSGGAIVYFNVFDSNGVSKLSGVFPAYEKYRGSNKIDETCNEKTEK